MRRLPPRPRLTEETCGRLVDATKEICAQDDPQARKEKAAEVYKRARNDKWFKEITNALGAMCGPGERCMLCSGSEASQVEHYRPKAVFPEYAMDWDNFLWSCGICNQAKGEVFPMEGAQPVLINPINENVWDFFYIDEFGNLTPKWRKDLDAQDPRALTTVAVLKLERDALQQTRQRRRQDLIRRVNDYLVSFNEGRLSRDDLRQRVRQERESPYQPDVADYFLDGPGKQEAPFSELLRLLT